MLKSQYHLVENYTMKCQLYPNKSGKEMIDRIINGVYKFYNNAVYDMVNNYTCTIEKNVDGKLYHYVDFNAICKAEYINTIKNKHKDSMLVPGGALSTKNGLFQTDFKRALSHKTEIVTTKSGKKEKKHTKKARTDSKGRYLPYSLEIAEPVYYNKKNPRNSYTYQLCLRRNIITSDNLNVFYIKLSSARNKNNEVHCTIPVRGWNKKIRFGEKQSMNFLEMVLKSDKYHTVTISKDSCGKYWICFKLKNVYKPIRMINNKEGGIDVGIKDLVITSEGEKYENPKFKKQEKRHIRRLSRKLSRRKGWKNQQFKNEYQKDKNIRPSKSYLHTKEKLAKLHKKISNCRENYNHYITTNIIKNYSFIGVETLNVSGMFRNRRLSNALSDAAMGMILVMLKYKADWYGRTIIAIDRWTPSSKRCSSCGYIRPTLTLNVREWTCPKCKTFHDRDVNAAKNIYHFAKISYQPSSMVN